MNEFVYWLWLSLACIPGSGKFLKLITKYKTPEAVYNLTESQLVSTIGSESCEYAALCNKDTEKAEQIFDFCTRKNIGILTYGDSNFPSLLKNIENPPVLLYYRGVLPDFNKSCFISVVGTRKLSDYGKTNTFKISYDLAKSGAVIVSGLAKGIDGVALAGALTAGRPTVAVIGSGIDVCYPIEHKRLAREIVKTGCVMTEFPPGTTPQHFNFPKRNRIISAISLATVVMEGSEKSGAIITARFAEKQGRRVYAFPGNVDNPNSQASNLLIKNGAKLFTTADDIISDFNKNAPAHLNPFNLLTGCAEYDINEALTDLEVYAATSPHELKRISNSVTTDKKEKISGSNTKAFKPVNVERTESNSCFPFDEPIFNIYKKIPLNKECSVESLIDEGHSYPDVMTALINLEIAGFIIMLPGDRVKRNLNQKGN